MANNVVDTDNSNKPRWLFDINAEERVEFTKAKTTNPDLKYGIISYTWGRWQVPNRGAEGSPKSVEWQVPCVEGLPLEKAKMIMKTMRMQYVWWDWMCVPQETTRDLFDNEKVIFREELSKQM